MAIENLDSAEQNDQALTGCYWALKRPTNVHSCSNNCKAHFTT